MDQFLSFIKILKNLGLRCLSQKYFSPRTLKDIFVAENKNHYNLWHQNDFRQPLIKIVYHGNKIIFHLGPKFCDIIAKKLKQGSSFDIFKKSIRKEIPKNCFYREKLREN